MITSIKKNKNILLIILMLMIVTGFIIYFMYMRLEHFTSTAAATNPSTTPAVTNPSTTLAVTNPSTTIPITTPAYTCAPPVPPVPVAIISRFFGVGFNVDLVSSSVTVPNYLIEYIPTTSTGTSGGVFSISSDGLLTIKLRNEQDPTQWWNITQVVDSTSTTPYYTVQPNSDPTLGLQYENGNLAIRTYNTPLAEGQKWILSQKKIL
jgi:zona occludens toxin (predicted ATPase)